jgi:hypothetical protein
MGVIGYYYLHENGNLLYKRDFGDTEEELLESSFVKTYWPVDPKNRGGAWQLVIEALALGANQERVYELVEKWGCWDDDAVKFAQHIGLPLVKSSDGEWQASDVNETYVGRGPTALEAMVDLCKKLGYRASKDCERGFVNLLYN